MASASALCCSIRAPPAWMPYAEMALMFASRAQLIAEVIVPALESGQWVLCDRFTDSTEAYQGAGRQLGSEAVLQLHKALCGGLWPDLTILMDCDVSSSVGRARRRNRAATDETPDENRFEKESYAFFTRVRNAFLEIARREPQRVVLVDATADGLNWCIRRSYAWSSSGCWAPRTREQHSHEFLCLSLIFTATLKWFVRCARCLRSNTFPMP